MDLNSTFYRAALRSQVAARTTPTPIQIGNIEERRTAILRKLRRFRDLQKTHMPGLSTYRADTPTPACVPEAVPLFLPSSIPTLDRARGHVCAVFLVDLEIELRHAQLSDSLEDLRSQLRLRSFTTKYKMKNVTGQRPNTMAQTLLKQISDKVRASANRYRRAHDAQLELLGIGSWTDEFRPLLEKDVRGLNERALTEREAEERRFTEQFIRRNDDDDTGEYAGIEGEEIGANRQGGEGHRALSWIWFAVGANLDLADPTMHEGTYCYTIHYGLYSRYPSFTSGMVQIQGQSEALA